MGTEIHFYFVERHVTALPAHSHFLSDEMSILSLLKTLILILALLSNFCNSLWIPLTHQGA